LLVDACLKNCVVAIIKNVRIGHICHIAGIWINAKTIGWIEDCTRRAWLAGEGSEIEVVRS